VARLQQGREVIEWGCVTATGTTARTKRGAGGASVRLRGGGHVAPAVASPRRWARAPTLEQWSCPARPSAPIGWTGSPSPAD